MNPPKLIATPGDKSFVIEEDGVCEMTYIYIYEGGKCTYDYLAFKVAESKLLVFEDFSVLTGWIIGSVYFLVNQNSIGISGRDLGHNIGKLMT